MHLAKRSLGVGFRGVVEGTAEKRGLREVPRPLYSTRARASLTSMAWLPDHAVIISDHAVVLVGDWIGTLLRGPGGTAEATALPG